MKPISAPNFRAPNEGYKVYQRFRGLDLSTDETQIDDSRSPKMVNMISDSGGYPELRLGWRTVHRFAGSGKVNSVHPFVLDGVRHMVCHVGTKIMRLLAAGDAAGEVYTESVLLENVRDARSQGFYFGGMLWILTGGEMLRYNGIVCERVDSIAYIPTTTTGRAPTGGGKSYEKVNLLSAWRKNTFVADGTSKDFIVDTGKIDAGSTARVWLNDTEMTSGFTIDHASGKVTFQAAPAAPATAGTANLTVQFRKTTEGAADKINKCRVYTTFGVNTGSRVFLSGNPDAPATEWYSGLNDPTYWPDLNFIEVGTSSFAIVNYLKYQGELLIIKEDNRQENTVWHHAADFDDAGAAVFPLKEGVSGVGGVARHSVQNLRDDPLFLSPQGVYAPVLSYGVNQVQRNLQCRSERINPALTRMGDLSEAVSAVWDGYYILGVDGKAYIADANQSRDRGGYEWYYWENIPAHCFAVDGDTLYFGTADGRLCRLNNDLVDADGERLMAAYSDDGAPIRWEWRSKLDHLSAPTRYKSLLKRGNGLQLKSYTRGDCEVLLRTEKDFGEPVETVITDKFSFSDVDFARFTFNTLGVQQIIIKKKIKKFLFVQMILRGEALHNAAGVYAVALHYTINDYAKKKGG